MPGEAFPGLKEDVHTFIKKFHQHIKTQNLSEIENDYQVKFHKLTEQYFVNSRWPSSEVVSQLVDKDKMFILLYNELYYRHIYARVSSGLSVEEMNNSYQNYTALFTELVRSPRPVQLVLPNQWLWDIIDEFLYQFYKFTIFRSRQKNKTESESLLKQLPRMWSIHSVLNVLYSLVEKSAINEQLSYYAKQGDPDEIADDFGRSPLYKMLGFFSLIGLCRLHCLLCDYNTAIKVLENIKFNRLEMYHDVFTCHFTTGYYLGVSYLMMRRYVDAIRTFSATLAFRTRGNGLVEQRSDLREYANKQADQMTRLLALCATICPTSIDHPHEIEKRDKYSETLHQLQQLEELEFVSTFDYGCPNFISPEVPDIARPGSVPSSSVESIDGSSSTPTAPHRQQIELFTAECKQQIDLLRLRSFLKLYTNIPVSKLRLHLNCSETDIHVSLMEYKYRMRQVTGLVDKMLKDDAETHKSSDGPRQTVARTLEFGQQLYPDVNFYIDNNVVHVADTTVDRRFSEYFVRHIEMLQQMNTTLDNLERQLHDTSVQGSA